MCIEMLVNGHPGAFVDFFYLSHKDVVELDRPTDDELLALGIDPERYVPTNNLTVESMRRLRDLLATAEIAQRSGDAQGVFVAWEEVASFFDATREYKTAAYFYAKCLHVAETTGWDEGETRATLNLGLVSERLGQLGMALGYHERHLTLVRARAGQPGAGKAALADKERAERHLLRVCGEQAELARSRGDAPLEAASLERLLDTAKSSGKAEEEHQAYVRMGKSHMAAHKLTEALVPLSKALRVAQKLKNIRLEGAVHSLLAQCFEGLHRLDDAVAALKELRRLSREASGEPAAPDYQGLANAACRLGLIFYQRGQYADAVATFEEMYTTARRMKDARLLNTARVNLGAARGLAMRATYLGHVASDLGAVLDWKCARVMR